MTSNSLPRLWDFRWLGALEKIVLRLFSKLIKEVKMNLTKLIGAALIVAGVLGLLYGGFSYTKDTTAIKLGPIELSVKEKKSINIPLWAGIGALVIGGILLGIGGKNR